MYFDHYSFAPTPMDCMCRWDTFLTPAFENEEFLIHIQDFVFTSIVRQLMSFSIPVRCWTCGGTVITTSGPWCRTFCHPWRNLLDLVLICISTVTHRDATVTGPCPINYPPLTIPELIDFKWPQRLIWIQRSKVILLVGSEGRNNNLKVGNSSTAARTATDWSVV